MKKKILVITAKWNDLITRSLREGASEFLASAGVEMVDHISVPGAYELPLAAKVAATQKKWDAVICLGCVIKGETDHFDFVAGQASSGIAGVALEHELPVIFGVLTTNTLEQAMHRAGAKLGNKGAEAAQTAVEMIKTLDTLRS